MVALEGVERGMRGGVEGWRVGGVEKVWRVLQAYISANKNEVEVCFVRKVIRKIIHVSRG